MANNDLVIRRNYQRNVVYLMNDGIRILHISDFHARSKDELYLEQRVAALFNDISQMDKPIDIVVFTGDLAYYGAKPVASFKR